MLSRQDRFLELQRRFVLEARDSVRDLRRMAEAAAELPVGPDAARFRKLAHDLRGAGGAFGFPDVSARAAAVEDGFASGKCGKQDLLASIDLLDRAIEDAAKRFDLDGAAPGTR